MAAVAAVGAAIFALNLAAQLRRLGLYRAHGLAFADPACQVPFCDTSLFWLAGRLARAGDAATLYGGTFTAFAARALPDHAADLPFLYPPPALLPAAAFSILPLAWAYAASALLSLVFGILILRAVRFPWAALLLGLVSPAAMWSLYLGQLGLPCAALLIAGLTLMARRPVLAGAALGLLAIKPQYALLAPVVVLAGRHWRALAAGVATLAALCGLAASCFGSAVWAAWLGPGRAAATAVLQAPGGQDYERLGTSVFWLARNLGAKLGVAWAAQAAVALATMGLCWRLWSRRAPQRVPATVFLTTLAAPYGFTDDLTGYALVLPLLARAGTPIRNAAIGLLWLAPAFTTDILRATGILPTPFFLLAALALALTARPAAAASSCNAPSRRPVRTPPAPGPAP